MGGTQWVLHWGVPGARAALSPPAPPWERPLRCHVQDTPPSRAFLVMSPPRFLSCHPPDLGKRLLIAPPSGTSALLAPVTWGPWCQGVPAGAGQAAEPVPPLAPPNTLPSAAAQPGLYMGDQFGEGEAATPAKPPAPCPCPQHQPLVPWLSDLYVMIII